MSRDPALLQTLQDVVSNNALIFLSDATALARHLLEGRVGVVLLDIETLGAELDPLATKLHLQLPDLALIATGTTHDEPKLAPLLSSGIIHRFLHKPVSAQRVQLFIDAGWRLHESVLLSRTHPALPQLPHPAPATSKGLLLRAIVAALMTAVASVVWFALHKSSPPDLRANRSAASMASEPAGSPPTTRASRP